MAHGTRSIRQHQRQPRSLLNWLPLTLAIFTGAVVAICLVRLAQQHTVSFLWPVVLPLLALSAAASILLVVGRRAGELRDRKAARWPALFLTTVVLLLSAIGMLARISLREHGITIWSEPLVGAVGLLALLGAAELARRYSPQWHLREVLVLAVVVLVVCEAAARYRVNGVRPGATSLLDWPTSLLAFLLLGLLGMALTRPSRPLEIWPARRRGGAYRTPWAVLPVIASLALLAYTASLSAAAALFAGGIAALASVGWRPHDRFPDNLEVGPVFRVRTGVACVAGFTAGAALVVLVGSALGIRGFQHVKMLASSATDPDMLFFHYPYLFGPGWPLHTQGIDRSLGAGQVILSTLGRETGLAGMTGLSILFIVLIGTLILLARRQQRASFGSAWTFGLAAFLGVQVLIAGLRLGRLPSLYSEGPPLLAGGAAWYVATLIAVGVALGCAARPGQPVKANHREESK